MGLRFQKRPRLECKTGRGAAGTVGVSKASTNTGRPLKLSQTGAMFLYAACLLFFEVVPQRLCVSVLDFDHIVQHEYDLRRIFHCKNLKWANHLIINMGRETLGVT